MFDKQSFTEKIRAKKIARINNYSYRYALVLLSLLLSRESLSGRLQGDLT